MNWDPIWEETFRKRDWGRYPNEELIRFVMRSFGQSEDRKQIRILEIGCASANNIWFLAREGFTAYGLDGSAAGIERGKQRLRQEGLAADFRVGDALDLERIYAGETFDAIVDVACFQCNTLSSVKLIVDQCYNLLVPGGRIFSYALSDKSTGNGRGEFVEPGTFTNIPKTPLAHAGLNHFFSYEDIINIYKSFSINSLEQAGFTYEDMRSNYTSWILNASRL